VSRALAAGLIAALAVAVGAFFLGRGTVSRPRPHPGTYDAGFNDAFSGFDGGWVFGQPYIVTLRKGGSGVTYRFARRWVVQPGVQYRACAGQVVCARP
jgi:hypothetical protein